MNKAETVGIIGAAGDLGRRMTVQACSASMEVIASDISDNPWKLDVGVDPAVDALNMLSMPEIAPGNQVVFERAETIHWCGYLSGVDEVDRLAEGQTLVLHASVMSASERAAAKLKSKPGVAGRLAIVHCMMNEQGTVILAEENDDNEGLAEHFERLGLNPKTRSVKEHDTIGALTQGLAAVLKHHIVPRLRALEPDGDLTPSGARLIDGITGAVDVWTKETYDTLRHNPELPSLITSLLAELNGDSE